MKTTGDISELAPQQPSIIDVYRSPKIIHGLAAAFSLPPADVAEIIDRLTSELEGAEIGKA